MAQTQDVLEYAQRKCSLNGVRLTEKRRLVLHALLDSDKALSAYDIVERCEQDFSVKIPAMSVYRILDFLQQEQLAHKLNLANKYVACCHIACSHSHEISQFLICSQCQKVKEINLGKSAEKKLKGRVEEAGFHLVSPQLEVSCLCDDCANAVA